MVFHDVFAFTGARFYSVRRIPVDASTSTCCPSSVIHATTPGTIHDATACAIPFQSAHPFCTSIVDQHKGKDFAGVENLIVHNLGGHILQYAQGIDQGVGNMGISDPSA